MNDQAEKTGDQERTTTRTAVRLLAIVAFALAAAACLVALVLYLAQDRIIYPGVGGAPSMQPGWDRTTIDVPGQGRLAAYLHPGDPERPVMLFFHGNAYGYQGSVNATASYAKAGYGILVPEYPGYAGNPGHPTEQGLEATADAAMTWLAKHGVAPSRIIVYGNSIGSGAAIHAALRPHRALVIVSGIADMGEVVDSKLPMSHLLLRDDWPNADWIAHVQGHKIIVHGLADQVVPYHQGEELAKAAGVPIITLPGDHSLAFDTGLQDAIVQSLDQYHVGDAQARGNAS